MAIDNSAGAGAAGAPLDFDRLDELIDSVNAYGGSKVLVMSKAMRRQLNALARSTMGGGVYQTSTNSYGMTVHRYQDCDILTVDRDAQGVEVDDSFQVWDAASSSWVDGGSIQGPQGVEGPQGPQGLQGDTGSQGSQGIDGRPQGARLGLDAAALPARQAAGPWTNHRGRALLGGAPLPALNSSGATGEESRDWAPGRARACRWDSSSQRRSSSCWASSR